MSAAGDRVIADLKRMHKSLSARTKPADQCIRIKVKDMGTLRRHLEGRNVTIDRFCRDELGGAQLEVIR